MSENKWTNEQWAAITEKDCNLLVAAAAGAGKTAVLVERIIKKITDIENPIDIDKLLVVTFTKAAASEMRERIGDAISKAIEKNPESQNIQRQLTLLGKASITTIHSFCLEVIRSNFQNINIDPKFRIADETESSLMKLEALAETFEEQYNETLITQGKTALENSINDSKYSELLDSYSGNKDDQALQDIVLNLYNFIQSSPFPGKWLEDATDSFKLSQDIDFSKTEWGKIIINALKQELEGLKGMIQKALEILKFAIGLEKYINIFNEDLINIDSVLTGIESINYQTIIEESTKEESITGQLTTNHSINNWDKVANTLQNIVFSTMPRVGKEVDTEKQEKVKKIRDEVKAGIKKLKEKYISSSSAQIAEDFQNLYPKMKCLASLVKTLSHKYAEKKNKKGIVDFNDLEHYCLEILTERVDVSDNYDFSNEIKPSKAALLYRERFEEILVDEYQDSNLVQEIIISMISRKDTDKPNVFMVGDVKQSIYRFRQARPELFLDKYNNYSKEKEGLNRKILLFKNFRSRKEVVDGVNFIFKQIMSETLGELNYTDMEALNPGAEFVKVDIEKATTGGAVELHLLQTKANSEENSVENLNEYTNENSSVGSSAYFELSTDSNSNDDISQNLEDEEMPDNIQAEARLVAGRIHELMQMDKDGNYFHVFDKNIKKYRRAQFRDFVILLRTTRNWSEVFAGELAMLGIPAFADTGSGFFKTIEVQIVLSLLQIIDNPMQDIPLISVLRSPIVGFTTDELADLRLADKRGLLFEGLTKLAKRYEEAYINKSQSLILSNELLNENGIFGEKQTKVQTEKETKKQLEKQTELQTEIEKGYQTEKKAWDFLGNLKKWREISKFLPTDQLIWRLYDETGYLSMVGAMPGGEQRQANLRMLFDRARQFEKTSYKGLFNFINFVDKLKSSKGDMGSAKILGENDNVVRIMSIHKSKGLEFPIVFLSGCNKKFNLQDMNKSILFHQDLGLGPDVVDTRLRLAYPSAAKQAIRQKIKTETLSEEMRILYVALTRAREKLILTGSVKDSAKALNKWWNIAETENDKLASHDLLKGSSYLDWIFPALLRHENLTPIRKEFALGYDFSMESKQNNKNVIDDESEWNVKIWDMNNVKAGVFNDSLEEADFTKWLEAIAVTDCIESNCLNEDGLFSTNVIRDEIERRLNWEYEYKELSFIPTKVSVSEMKKRLYEESLEDVNFYDTKIVNKPMFMQEKKGLTPSEKGTILHFVMQHLDFKNNDFEKQINEMIERDLLTKIQADTVDTSKIRKFLDSTLGLRMINSGNYKREVPFNIEIPCSEVYRKEGNTTFEGETVLLQGVIDCYFEESDGIVLIDYKTDYVAEGEEVVKRYEHQLRYYKRALEKLTGKKVKEKGIYFFSNNRYYLVCD